MAGRGAGFSTFCNRRRGLGGSRPERSREKEREEMATEYTCRSQLYVKFTIQMPSECMYCVCTCKEVHVCVYIPVCLSVMMSL